MLMLSCGFFRDLVDPAYQSQADFSGRVVWVRNSSGETLSVAGADVLLGNNSTLTDSNGRFAFQALATGSSLLKVRHDSMGFSLQNFPVTVTLADTARLYPIQRQPPRINGITVTRNFFQGSGGQCLVYAMDYDSNISACVVDWGDGTTPNYYFLPPLSSALPIRTMLTREHNIEELTHTYSAAGLYTVTVMLYDYDNDSSQGRRSVTVTQKPKPQLDAVNFSADTLFADRPESLEVSVLVSSTESGFIRKIEWQYLSFDPATGEDSILGYKTLGEALDAATGAVPRLFSIKISANEFPRVSDFADTNRNSSRKPGDSLLVSVLAQDGESGTWNKSEGWIQNKR